MSGALPATPTVRDAQSLAAMAGLPTLEARMLLTHVTGLTRTQLITHDDDILSLPQRDAFATLLARRLAGEPMAYLIGEREFFGRRFRVTPDVLIPRPDTEIAAESSLARLAGVPQRACWTWARVRASWRSRSHASAPMPKSGPPTSRPAP